MRLLSPRDLNKMQNDHCFYMPMIDKNGGILNDPVVLKIKDDEFWISIADSDYLFYALGVADALNFDVVIDEPDISPLAIQGPKSDDLMVKVFGAEIRDIKFFRYKKVIFDSIDNPLDVTIDKLEKCLVKYGKPFVKNLSSTMVIFIYKH